MGQFLELRTPEIVYSLVGAALLFQSATVPAHPVEFLLLLLTVLSGIVLLPGAGAAIYLAIPLTVTLLSGTSLTPGEIVLVTGLGTIFYEAIRRSKKTTIPKAAVSVGVAVLGSAAATLAVRATGSLGNSPVFPAQTLIAALVILLNWSLASSFWDKSRTGLAGVVETFRKLLPICVIAAYVSSLIRSSAVQLGTFHALVEVPILLLAIHCFRWWSEATRVRDAAEKSAAQLRDRSIDLFASAISSREYGHQSQRMSTYCNAIGTALGLSGPEIEDLIIAARLHNIGKIIIPDHVLLKPSALTPEEWAQMRTHPTVGADMLASMDFPAAVVQIVRAHHEKWDGTGYPCRISGENIPLGARILAAVDSLDALVSERAYRSALPVKRAVELLVKQGGTSYDPLVVYAIRDHYIELEKKLGLPLDENTSITFEAIDRLVADPIEGARRQNQLLRELSGRLAHAVGAEEVGRVVHKCLSQMISYDTMALYSHRSGRIEPIFVEGPNKHLFSHIPTSTRSGLSGFAVHQNTSILNGNTAFETFYQNDSKVFSRLQSALAVPVTGHDGHAGVITLYHSTRNAFTVADQSVIESARSIIGTAIEGAVRIRDAESLAATDYLTGIPNARSLSLNFEKQLANAARDHTQICIFVCDLDGFKQVNDSFGHLKGNQVLQQVAAGLRECCRPEDFVARMGGDEFVIVVPGLTEDVSANYAERLRRIAVDAGWSVCGEACLGMSVGAVYYPQDGFDATSLLAIADGRMYKAKQEGKMRKQLASAC